MVPDDEAEELSDIPIFGEKITFKREISSRMVRSMPFARDTQLRLLQTLLVNEMRNQRGEE
ncbi:hypothetical protein X798_01926 [Onchocerca flexuosa]|nr:hypothetical protein X798_01926 [Onchocerca flexuosa]